MAPNLLIIRYLVVIFSLLSCAPAAFAQQPGYLPYYDPSKGFKPAQINVTKLFLQMAGSLEYDGSPEPYIRHVMAEHARIDAIAKARGDSGSSRPAYLTDAYVNQLIANWNKISPPLKLDAFCRDAGKNIRYAILGSKNMTVAELVDREKSLNETELKNYRSLLAKPYFSKSDFPAMEKFYSSAFDKLSETGKDQISRRTRLGTQSPDLRAKELAAPPTGTAVVRLFNQHQDRTVAFLEDHNNPKANADTLQASLIDLLKLNQELNLPKDMAAFDAEPLIYSHKIREGYQQRIEAVQKTAQSPTQSAMIEKAMRLMYENLVVITQSEFEAALCEKAAQMREAEH
jgi:hypothetical protein